VEAAPSLPTPVQAVDSYPVGSVRFHSPSLIREVLQTVESIVLHSQTLARSRAQTSFLWYSPYDESESNLPATRSCNVGSRGLYDEEDYADESLFVLEEPPVRSNSLIRVQKNVRPGKTGGRR
jgi:hypothetical protein